MTRVEELQSQIESLPDDEFAALHKWISERDWQKWDKQFEADVLAGRLDFVKAHVRESMEKDDQPDL